MKKSKCPFLRVLLILIIPIFLGLPAFSQVTNKILQDTTILPPSEFNAFDNPNDNGSAINFYFRASPNHPGNINSPYYRGDSLLIDYYIMFRSNISDINDKVIWAVISATPLSSQGSDIINVLTSSRSNDNKYAYYWIAAGRGDFPTDISAVLETGQNEIILSDIIGPNRAISAKNNPDLKEDFNGDSKTDMTDFAYISWVYENPEDYEILFDLDLDGSVDITDIEIFGEKFGHSYINENHSALNTGLNAGSVFELTSEQKDKKQFEITVTGKSLKSLAGYSFVLKYNPDIYQFIELTEGTFLESSGGDAPLLIKHSEEPGCVFVSGVLADINSSLTPAGDGNIAEFKFNRIGFYTGPVTIEKIEVLDCNYKSNTLADFTLEYPVTLPENPILHNNYPNPFNSETMINYELSAASQVTLKIYNTLGQEVKTLVNGKIPAGYYSVKWDGTNNSGVTVNSGIFFYYLKTETFTCTKKMVLVK